MKKQIEAFSEGYRACMEDLQRDLAENFMLGDVEWLYVDAKKRTAEYGVKLKKTVDN